MGIGNPDWEGYLQACPNCGGTKKPICEFVDCYCSDWDEDDWYTNDSFDRFVLETWTGHERGDD